MEEEHCHGRLVAGLVRGMRVEAEENHLDHEHDPIHDKPENSRLVSMLKNEN